MNLPNALTVSRLVAIPPLMYLLLARFDYHDQVAAAVFVVFSLTDTMDGQIARRRGTVSDLGKFLDPLADKLFVLSVLIVLVQERLIAAWVVVVIFSRELLITLLRTAAAGRGTVIAAAPLGKTKTVTQVAAVTLLILQRPYPWLALPATLAVAFAVLFTISSGLDYMWRWRHVLVAGDPPPAGSSVEPAARELGGVLEETGLTLALAESCTGGLLAALITDVPGSSGYFLGGVVAYSNSAKEKLLGVAGKLLDEHGAVSAEVAEAMASGARARFGTALAAGVTGIAGPDADGTDKPVGLTYVAVASPSRTSSREFTFHGDRWANRRQAALEALGMLVEAARSVAATQGAVKTA
ncbi:MAG TPA: CDP-diacylglycerol--glycerol-3-phosphate 3-phosphatidyltransferase [Candidatus Dormibacteraeota bacterium]|nr:CDP-diacylglycerol--glycerol-3-phosphate 3-phosphatidyltransferase [Candidatus Dormibacteraeota bacterium]